MTTNTPLILLQRHGLTPLPGSLTRIVHWYVSIDDLLSRAPSDEEALVAWVIGGGLRTPLFMLEGLYRLYAEAFPDPMEDLLEEVKLVEDLMGQVDYTVSMDEAGRQHALPEAALAVLDHDRRAASRALAETLREGGWVGSTDSPPPVIRRHLESLLQVPWEESKKDRRFLARALSRTCRETRREEYDLGALEEGLHELRRDLRWFPISLYALRDVAVLTDDAPDALPVPKYGALLDHAVAASRFAKLPTEGWTEATPAAGAVVAMPDPLRISRTLFLANTKAIDELGDLKDQGQVIEALVRAVRESEAEADPEKAEHLVLEKLGLPADTVKTLLKKGRAIYKELSKRELLRHLGRQLKKQS